YENKPTSEFTRWHTHQTARREDGVEREEEAGRLLDGEGLIPILDQVLSSIVDIRRCLCASHR
ncbi:unnamed protein product, partial [Ectocarpus sp. 8 AP-2014]